MSRIPFIEARFFNPDETTYTLEKRFVQHLRDLRSRELSDTNAGAEHADSSENAARHCHSISPSDQERARIKCRVDLLLERRKAASRIGHLTREHRERLAVLRDGVRLAAIATEHQADELAAELHGEMPWMAPATEAVWHAMRRSVREGWPGLRLPPILLDGPPGIGKSHWARRLGQLLTVPTAVVEATSENASFGVVGSQRGWGSAHPGRLLETILQARVANPVLVVDEVEKAGKVSSIKGHTFGLAEALFMYLGAKHMVTGYDHILFLVGVVFFLYKMKDVAIYVSLFALGHSTTMLMGVWFGWGVNAYVVDAIIGLSVVYKELDNLGAYQRWFGVQPNTKVATLVFGFFHGTGLATKILDYNPAADRLILPRDARRLM